MRLPVVASLGRRFEGAPGRGGLLVKPRPEQVGHLLHTSPLCRGVAEPGRFGTPQLLAARSPASGWRPQRSWWICCRPGLPPRTAGRALLIRQQVRELDHGPDLDRAATGHGNPRGDGDRLVAIPRIDQDVAAQVLLRLRERTVGHRPFAVADPDARRRGGPLERGGRDILPRGIELVRPLRPLAVTALALAVSQGVLVNVNQQHVPHDRALRPCRASRRQWPPPRARAPPLMSPPPAGGRPLTRWSDPAGTRRIARRAGVAACRVRGASPPARGSRPPPRLGRP